MPDDRLSPITTYTNYYTSSDTFLYVEASSSALTGGSQIWIDKLDTIAFNESISGSPIYGIGQPEFGFSNLGNIIVSGEISIRFTDENYLVTAIKKVVTGETRSVASQKNNAKNAMRSSATVDQTRALKNSAEEADILSNSRILDLPYYFNFRLVFNNENQYHKDISKTLVIKDVRILSSQIVSSVSLTGPVNTKYNFIARAVV